MVFKGRWPKVVAGAAQQENLQAGQAGLPKPKQEKENVIWLLSCCIFIIYESIKSIDSI